MSPLDQKIRDFLPTLRLGIDFGETAGGIALLRDRKILHNETFVDFHEATLETRRTLRRGRRTRHARKMRLARLRSWLLRQKLPAGRGYRRTEKGWEPGGDRLPDPYWIFSQPRYQTKPGVYQKENADPVKEPGWIEEAKAGRVDAAGFVCAVSLIFRKRGYKYDDEDFSEYKDARLVEFLDSCCMLSRDEALSKQLRKEIESRESDGKKKPKLHEAIEQALDRPEEPRKAIPRALVEHKLEEVVAGFARSAGLDEAAKARWIKELKGLLNRFVRLARFENRIKATCSWCEKKTPRTAKVLELQYKAAVRNIKVRGPNGWERLSPEQEKPLLDWRDRWLKHQEGNHAFSRKAKDKPTERSPTKENIEKYLWSIGAKASFIKGKDGRHKLGFPMARQLEDLLKNKRKGGRSGLCKEHLAMASEGKTMKDAGIEWHTLRVRKAPNPRREQHDERVLRRVEAILFRRGKTGKDAWRHGPVKFITLEVPEPSTMRVSKGEMTERQDLSLRERLHKETGGVCVYTGAPVSVEEAEIEHIVPRSKGGPDVRVNLVCASKAANKEKDNRLPSEWLGWQSPRFNKFQSLVESLSDLPKAKKELLLLEPGSSYPENDTPLAHVGARPRQFVAEMVRLFKRYGVEPPTLHYEIGKPLIQRVGGRWTTALRRSWLFADAQGKMPNFPDKNRRDLSNHAQDAALLAATPPHTWRDLIMCEQAVRPCAKKDANGQIVRENGVVQTEMRQRPGVARLDLAPDWRGFADLRKRPLVRVLGRRGMRWRAILSDLNPLSIQGDRHTQCKSLASMCVHQIDRIVDEGLREALQKEIRSLGKEFKKHGSNCKENLPRSVLIAVWERGLTTKRGKSAWKGLRGVRLYAHLGGLPFTLEPKDGPPRTLQAKPAAEGAIFWSDRKGRFKISLRRPTPLSQSRIIAKAIEPEITEGARRLGEWFRNQIVVLPASDGFPKGWYRIKEFSDSNITVMPENAVTKQMAEALGLDPDQIINPERKLGKKELAALFPFQKRPLDIPRGAAII